jgi:hypothetical protein
VRRLLLLTLALGLPACLGARTPAERLVDAAYDYNVSTRFGRMDVALGYVAAKARDAFTKRHAAWGDRVRVLDLEVGGMRMTSKNEANVTVRVAWQRVDESDLRMTELSQTWRDDGGWHLGEEARKSGDEGLLPEDEAKPDTGDAAASDQTRSGQVARKGP